MVLTFGLVSKQMVVNAKIHVTALLRSSIQCHTAPDTKFNQNRVTRLHGTSIYGIRPGPGLYISVGGARQAAWSSGGGWIFGITRLGMSQA